MKKEILLLLFVAVIPFLMESCKLSTSPETGDENEVISEGGTIKISGQVVDSLSGDPLADVVIRITDDSTDVGAVSDEGGNYSIEITITKGQEFNIRAFKEGYFEKINVIFAVAGRDVEVPTMQLRAFRNAIEESIDPATINLLSQSAENIGVRESGSIEVAEITFEVRDSSGVTIDLDHKVVVHFKLEQSPGGGEFLFPDSATTNGKGQVEVALNSGTIAGVAQVSAEINFNGKIIRSKPVLIAIHGGLPDLAHFSIAFQQRNVPGLIEFGLR